MPYATPPTPDQIEKDFFAGRHVRYVPIHAENNASHPDCENGVVTSTRGMGVFVRFKGSTSERCSYDQLI